MVWLRLVWWVLWRGLVYGAVEGALFGAVIALVAGAVYGVVMGAALGAILGLLNGISLALMTRFFFYPPRDRSRYIECIRILAIPIDFVVVLAYSAMLLSVVGFIPALLAATTAFALSPRFADYAASQLAQTQSHHPPANMLSQTEN